MSGGGGHCRWRARKAGCFGLFLGGGRVVCLFRRGIGAGRLLLLLTSKRIGDEGTGNGIEQRGNDNDEGGWTGFEREEDEREQGKEVVER